MYEKLVRDNIPDIIRKNGEEPIIEILDNERYKEELEKKLQEECMEVINAKGNDRIEELADLLEVMYSLTELEDKIMEDVEKVRIEKKLKRGAFSNKIYLKGVK